MLKTSNSFRINFSFNYIMKTWIVFSLGCGNYSRVETTQGGKYLRKYGMLLESCRCEFPVDLQLYNIDGPHIIFHKLLLSGPNRPKAKHRVSFSQVIGFGPIEKNVSREESPFYDDKKLQIFSFVSLIMLVFIAIAILVDSHQPQGMSFWFLFISLCKWYIL